MTDKNIFVTPKPLVVNRRRTVAELRWVGPPLVVTAVVYAVYLFTHDFPAVGGGFYAAIMEQILRADFGLPARLPEYTPGGIPFAYPPLGYYVGAAAQATLGVSAAEYIRLVPGVLTLVSVVPTYYAFREILESQRGSRFATTLLFVSPMFFNGKISGMGTIRSWGYLFAITGLFLALPVFKRRVTRRWILAGVMFGLTVLSHPKFGLFMGVSVFAAWLGYDRSGRGFAAGAGIAGIGALVASPWAGMVIANHGIDVFLRTSGSWGGLLNPLYATYYVFTYSYPELGSFPVRLLLPQVIVGYYCLRTERYFLPGWLAGTGLVIGGRWMYPAAVVAATVFVYELLLPALDDGGLVPSVTVDGDDPIVVGVLVVGLLVGGVWAAGVNPAGGDTPMRQLVSDDDRAAMEWVATETPPNATFLLPHESGTWFPYMSDRAMIVSPWGSEWIRDHQAHVDAFAAMSGCSTPACIAGAAADHGFTADYIYVYRSRLDDTALEDTDFRVAYENSRVVVFEVPDDSQIDS